MRLSFASCNPMVSTESGVTLHSMDKHPFSALAPCTFSATWPDTSKLPSSSSHVRRNTSHTRKSEMSPCHARAWKYTSGSLSLPDFIIPTLFHYIILFHQLSLLSFINNSLIKTFPLFLIISYYFKCYQELGTSILGCSGCCNRNSAAQWETKA